MERGESEVGWGGETLARQVAEIPMALVYYSTVRDMGMESVQKELRRRAQPKRVPILKKFFKTGKGEYAEGDLFLGVTAPDARQVARLGTHLPLKEVKKLLKSRHHEERLVALFILNDQFKKGDEESRTRIFHFYLSHTQYINNWDLVDSSAYKLVGPYLQNRDRGILTRLARSKSLWERRIAIISTLHFIRQHDFADALKISRILLKDEHDLIHKAVGWMLREVGNRSRSSEELFLRQHYKKMPRTMLRYAIEKFPEKRRQSYLKGSIR